MKKYIFILFYCLILSNLKAEIKIVGFTDPSIKGACDGTITVEASGTAAPFTIFLTATNPETYYDDSASGVNGTYVFNNLCGGTYELSVSNDYMCADELGQVELRGCGDPIITGQTKMADCGDNGLILLQVNGGESTTDYAIQWSDGAQVFQRANLSAGSYCTTVTDLNCNLSSERCFKIFNAPSSAEIIYTEIIPAYSIDAQDGSISVAVNDLGDYTYAWSNGQTGQDIFGLSPGNYTVTATSAQGCPIESTIELTYCHQESDIVLDDEGPFDGELRMGFEISIDGNDFILQSDESIDLSVTLQKEGSSAILTSIPDEYTIRWDLPKYENQDQTTFWGTESITIPSSIFDYFPVVEVQVQVSNGCHTRTLVKRIFSCGAEVLSSRDQELVAGYFVEVEKVPCENLNDGIINIRIPNPGGEPLSVFFEGVDQSAALLPGNPSILTLRNLEAGSYSIKTVIGECENNFSFQLESTDSEEKYIGLDGDYCVHEQQCNGEVIDIEYSPAELNYIATRTRFVGKCKVPILCNGSQVAERAIKKQWMYVYQWKELINLALTNGSFSGSSNGDSQSDYLSNIQGDANQFRDCRKVKICPANLQRSGKGWGAGLHVKEFHGFAGIDGNCLVGQCGTQPERLCIGDDYIWTLNRDIQPYLDCAPAQFRLYDLYIDHASGYFTEKIPNYEDSHLARVLNGYLNAEEFDTRIYCATLTVCLATLEVFNNNINSIVCGTCELQEIPGSPDQRIIVCPGDNPPSNIGINPNSDVRITFRFKDIFDNIFPSKEGRVANENRFRIGNLFEPLLNFCENIFNNFFPKKNDLSHCPKMEFAPDNPKIETETALISNSTQTEEIRTKLFQDTIEQEVVVNFAEITFDGVKEPKLILESEGMHYYYDYAHESAVVEKHPFEQVPFIIEVVDEDLTIYCEETEESKGYELHYGNLNTEWSMPLTTNDLLEVKAMHRANAEIFIGGLFKGNLFYGNQFLTRADKPKAFLLKVDSTGAGKTLHLIGDLQAASNLSFSLTRSGDLLVGGMYAGNSVQLNGENIQLPHNADQKGIFVVKIASDNQAQLIHTINQATEQIEPNKFIDLAYSSEGANYSVMFTSIRGNNNQGPKVPFDSTLVLYSSTTAGNLNFIKSFDVTELEGDKLGMTFSDNDFSNELILGLSLKGTIQLGTTPYTSNGQSDILLVKLNGNGGYTWVNQYGTAENENVSQLMYSEQVLYFGGAFSGSERVRTIGNYQFYDLTETNKRAFISYIIDPDNSGANNPAAFQSTNTDQTKASTFQIEGGKNQIHVYPNPFVQSLTILLDRSNDFNRIEITDQLGRVVREISIEAYKIKYQVDLGDRANGIYFIKAYNLEKELVGVKRVVQTKR